MITNNRLERKGIYPINKVFSLIEPMLNPNISDNDKRKARKFILDEDEMWANSQRYQTFFYRGCTCCKCGLKASYFAKERNYGSNGRYHLNLYGINEKGEEVLFTKDHIYPHSKGGINDITNYQTMCEKCNNNKSNNTNNLTLKNKIEITVSKNRYGRKLLTKIITINPKYKEWEN